jgi:membrane associated rhomboid family serine protease
MLPLRDNNPTRSFPIVTVAIILANCAVFYWQNSGGPQMNDLIDGRYGFVPWELTHNQALQGIGYLARNGHIHYMPGSPLDSDPRSRDAFSVGPPPQPIWLSIFTAMFMHGSLMHIGGNMLFLWIFGNNVEDVLGKMRYLAFYLGCGVIAALAQTCVDPNSIVPNIGASGAIAGVMGAYIVIWPEAKVLTLIFLGFIGFLREISAFWVLGIWIAIQAVTGYYGLGGQSTGGVAYFAHIGGFSAGIILILLLGGRKLGRRKRVPY